MNEVIRNIKTRRSIRKYKSDMIKEADLNTIIEAGLYAPSTKGRQARHLIVVKGLEKVNEVNDLVKRATAAATEPEQQIYKERVLSPAYTINMGAPIFMIVTADVDKSNAMSDGAVLLENMFLAAHSLGVSSVWINQLTCLSDVSPMREFLTKMGVPETHKIVGGAAFGYNDGEHPEAMERRQNVTVYE